MFLMDYLYNNNVNNVPLFVSAENVFWKNETFFFLESYVIFPLFGSARENELENVFWCLGGAANY